VVFLLMELVGADVLIMWLVFGRVFLVRFQREVVVPFVGGRGSFFGG
jgi:hypothetical protein